jgi:type I restriction enzyme S subunit
MIKKTNTLIPEIRFPEFLNEAEWVENTFEELFKIGNGRDYKHLGKGEIPVYGSGGYMLSVNDYLYDGESVCIGRKGTIDKPMFLSGKFWTVDTLFYTHSFKNCLPKYIHYVFQNINWLKHNEAGGVPSLSKTNIYKIKTLVPKPKEQQKIASCLCSLDELIDAQNKKLHILKDHKKGLMQKLFPQEGETVPKYRFPEFVNDGKWANLKLGEICKITSGGTPNRSTSEFWNGDIPWISTTLIDFNTINQANEYITEIGLQNSSAKMFLKGTILMAMYGQGKTRGKVAILGIEATTNQACAAIILKKGYNTDYVFQYLAAHYDEIRELSNKGGQENLSGGLIEIIPISIPKPKEQQKIADCLSSLDALITGQTQKIQQLKLHKKGLMQGLFPKIND